jgi:hypothetical protein
MVVIGSCRSAAIPTAIFSGPVCPLLHLVLAVNLQQCHGHRTGMVRYLSGRLLVETVLAGLPDAKHVEPAAYTMLLINVM